METTTLKRLFKFQRAKLGIALMVVIALFFLIPAMSWAQNTPPVADAGEDLEILVGEYAVLQGSATDPDGNPIASYLWTVESAPAGSSPIFSDDGNPNSTFTTDLAGDYVLSLVASDGAALSDPDFVTIHVRDILPPEAVINVDVSSGPAPLTVQFDASQSTVDPNFGPLTYDWSFGDGESSPDVSPVHTYDIPGSYNVALRVFDTLDQSDLDTIEVTVTTANNPPEAAPTATPNEGQPPLVVQFNANATDPDGDPLTYLWDFGDPDSLDNTSTLPDPQHVYESPGVYMAWLTVSDGAHDVSASVAVLVSAGKPLSTSRASVVAWTLGGGNKATISYWGDLDLPAPGPDDVISLTFDGIKLFSKPFSQFEPGLNPNEYFFVQRWLLARIDLDSRTIYVMKRKANIKRFDNSAGVDVKLLWGDEIAVDQFVMTQVTDLVWTYER